MLHEVVMRRIGWATAFSIALTGAALGGETPMVVFVDAEAGPGGDGQSWATAYDNLQDALSDAANSEGATQVWVADGVYVPSVETDVGDARSVTFTIDDELALYGGFAGGEASIDDRDPAAHESILSGDVLGDDGPGFSNRADNAYHVLFIDSPVVVVVDGFSIEGGSANVAGDLLTIAGGGVFADFNAQALFRRCVFRDNESEDGGAVHTRGTSVVLERCTFHRNRAVSSSTASGLGGAVSHSSTSSVCRMVNCLFFDNHASGAGGAVSGFYADIEVINCTVVGNTCDGDRGGGVICQGPTGILTLSNSVVWGNSAVKPPSSEYHQFWAPTPYRNINYSCVQDWSGASGGSGNTAANPVFADIDGVDDNPATYDDNDYRLSASSPCIDAGQNAAVPMEVTTDYDGSPRFVDDPNTADTGVGDPPLVDLGAFEFQGRVSCAADIDAESDGVVNVFDLLTLLAGWGTDSTGAAIAPPVDVVNVFDLLELLSAWGPCN